jgi:ABC-type microcin C transport system permease subunit YejE
MAASRNFAISAAIFAFVFLAAVSDIAAQDKPLFSEYKGITIGMPMADARQKLGKAKEETDAEDYWEFEKDESVRVLYGPEKQVRAISVNYDAKESGTPTPLTVFGKEIAAKPDGSMHKLVTYDKAGFWISYVRTAGEDAMVIVTLQKIDKR